MALLFLPIAWSVTVAGRTLGAWLRLPASATSLERNMIGFALGLGLLAYGILALGVLGLLYPIAGLGWVVALAALGGRQHRDMACELAANLRGIRPPTLPAWGMILLFAAFAVVSLVGVFTPPEKLEWDSLSYHLADPKIYLQAHRISYLPWESHSNFAFTAEMWYTLGLMAHGSVPLAKCFHFACAVGTCCALYAVGARHLTPRIGAGASLLFASTPFIFWEAGTAYADLAPTFFATLTLLALANGIAARDDAWLRVGAVLMGLTLSTKATALSTLALFALALLVWRIRSAGQGTGRAVGQVALWCLVALVVGSPWYIKSTVYTHNPVYPFYYKIFGGRNWNAQDAARYDASNTSFGTARTGLNALLAPWNITMNPLPNHGITSVRQSFNDLTIEYQSLIPVFLACLFFPALWRGVTPGVIKALGVYALAGTLFWFITVQYVRYLLPLVPVFCLLSAWVIDQSLRARALSGYALAGLTACSLAFSLFVGAMLLQHQLPVVTGQVSRDEFLAAKFYPYPAMQFINSQLPPNAKIVMYGNPLGFYCDRAYLWGDAQHSALIPYDRLHSGEDLRLFLIQQLGVTHLLVNSTNFMPAPGGGDSGLVYDLITHAGTPVYNDRGIVIYSLAK